MKLQKIILFLLLTLSTSLFINAQANPKIIAPPRNQAVRFTPAYSEVLLRKTERESELEEFLLDYTEDFPKVKEIKFELGLLNKEMDKILAVNTAESGKLSLA
ncbi:MAG: hypothetical protein M3388_04005, partial [Acidobacteriota bacterium]|nr:hypothetical protein [Acidobacteriota bacterium]